MLHDTEVRCFNARECAKRARRADAVAEAQAYYTACEEAADSYPDESESDYTARQQSTAA